MAAFDEELWKEAFLAVESQFEVENLLPEQKQAITSFFGDKHVFVNLPTGFGKSLIFQCLPLVSDIFHRRPRGSSLIVVLSPLRSLMEDHVNFLNNVGVPSIAIGDEEDPDIIQQVLNGCYVVVFGSPECFLSTTTWRGIFSAPSFREMLIGVVIDEAHCIVQWGLPGVKKVPFRKWYSCLGELNSLAPNGTKLMVLTATATKSTKDQILETLNLSANDVLMIQQTPDRPNLFYAKQYVDKNDPLVVVFGTLISELETMGVDTPRTLIYCQTRKQCSVLFRMFEVFLGSKMFSDGSTSPQKRLVEMFHAGTPKRVKEHIIDNMTKENGHLRVAICTVAFGMGINCKQVRRVVHFGPSKTVEQYVQECGRAGRDGLGSTCILLHNGLLSAHCDRDMKSFLQHEGCSRKWLMGHFESTISSTGLLHECCGHCAGDCNCQQEGCKEFWSPSSNTGTLPVQKLSASGGQRSRLTRTVSTQQKKELKKELYSLQQEMVSDVNLDTMVTCPNVLMEFNYFHINQVLEHCNCLFTIRDVVDCVEIWRMQYAIGILRVLQRVFNDIDIDSIEACEDVLPAELSNYSDWSQVRDDSTLVAMLDSQDLEDLSSFNTCMDTADSSFFDTSM